MYRRRYSRSELTYLVRDGRVDLEQLYKMYYSLRPGLREPRDIERREFAFQYFGSDTYHRHLSFSSMSEVLDHMIENPPRQAYYSVALYELPEAKSMEEKGWIGSDLFFDIDVDHLPECDGVLPNTECLLKGLEMAYRVVDMAKRDFGAEAGYVYFTGHRGFHIVVECSECFTLGREERREIAQYIAAQGLDFNIIFPLEPPKGYQPALPSEEEPGWRGWIAKQLGGGATGSLKSLGKDWIDQLYDAVRKTAVEIDHQVTQDPSRLLRIEGSLNGKTSLLVVGVSRDWRPDYRYLSPFKGEVTARCHSDIPSDDYYGFKGGFREGEEVSLPAEMALVFESKGLCETIGGEIVVRAYTGWGSL